MGCSASRPETLLSSQTIEQPLSSPSPLIITTPKSKTPNRVSRTSSLPNHLVHHPPLRKGDTHHLVSLTSTTYGSLLLIDSNPKDLPSSSSSSSTSSPSKDYPSPDSVINTWELMAGLDAVDFDHSGTIPTLSKPSSLFLIDDRRCYSFDSTNATSKKSNLDPIKTSSVHEKPKILGELLQSAKLKSFDDDDEEEEVPVENVTKPLWQHLSEELILADLDPNVVSSFRKAESSKKSGFNQLKKTKSSGSDAKVSPLFEYKVELPGTEDRIVIYFTSLRGIRRTYEDCCVVRTIFKGLRVPVDERDISMDSAYRNELQCALDKNKVALSLPQVFVKGKYLGGVEKVKQLHEDGELAKVVEGFPVQDPSFVCENCGDARFVPCSNCNGSRKVYEEEEGQLRRCSNCNENGLIRCPSCCS